MGYMLAVVLLARSSESGPCALGWEGLGEQDAVGGNGIVRRRRENGPCGYLLPNEQEVEEDVKTDEFGFE